MSDNILKEKILKINKLVDPIIEQLLIENVNAKNYEITKYQCSTGGKKIRSALVILSGQVFGCSDVNELLYPAASIEILHNSTLIIDDIIDHSDIRRSQPTTWKKYGKSVALCLSFSYIASVFSGLNNTKNKAELTDLYSKALKILIDGEIEDILFERSGREDEKFVVENRYIKITKDDYFDMIGKKTAILLQTCCIAGAISAGASKSDIKLIGKIGYNLGIAFQLVDDILDIFGSKAEFGKQIGKDIYEKKMGNIVIILAMKQLNSSDKKKLCNIYEKQNCVTDREVAYIKNIVTKTNAKEKAEKLASYFIKETQDLIKKLPQNKYTQELKNVAEYIVNREK